MVDFIVCAATNLFRMYLIYRFMTVFLGRSDADRKKELLAYACFYILNTALFWEFRTAWINILCNIIGIGIIAFMHTQNNKLAIFATCSIYLINMGCDVAGTAMFIPYRDGEVHSQVYAAIAVFMIFVCELITEKLVTIHENAEETQNFSLIPVPLCSIMVICFLIYADSCTNEGIAIVSIGLLIINFFMLYLYNLLLHSFLQKYEMELLRQKVQIYANQIDVILQNEEKVKALRHDMKHHMNELKLLANKYDADGIKSYIDKMECFVQNPKEIVASGNLEIDSVLNYMLEKAKEELQTVEVKVVLPEQVKHSFDINVLLGNLLENAIEAAGQTTKKYMSAAIILKQGVLKIKIENSFEPDRKAPLTTKKAKEQHGIGLKNVRKIVEAYNGTMEVTKTEDIFCVNLILYMSQLENESAR